MPGLQYYDCLPSRRTVICWPLVEHYSVPWNRALLEADYGVWSAVGFANTDLSGKTRRVLKADPPVLCERGRLPRRITRRLETRECIRHSHVRKMREVMAKGAREVCISRSVIVTRIGETTGPSALLVAARCLSFVGVADAQVDGRLTRSNWPANSSTRGDNVVDALGLSVIIGVHSACHDPTMLRVCMV